MLKLNKFICKHKVALSSHNEYHKQGLLINIGVKQNEQKKNKIKYRIYYIAR